MWMSSLTHKNTLICSILRKMLRSSFSKYCHQFYYLEISITQAQNKNRKYLQRQFILQLQFLRTCQLMQNNSKYISHPRKLQLANQPWHKISKNNNAGTNKINLLNFSMKNYSNGWFPESTKDLKCCKEVFQV